MERREFLRIFGSTTGLLVLSSCINIPENTMGQATAERAGPQEISIKADEFSFKPNKILLKLQKPVSLTIINKGKIAHDLKTGMPIKDLEYQQADNKNGTFDVDFEVGHTAKLTFTPIQTGDFPFFCDIKGHKESGMVGTFTVKA